jgi:hypothetical protein
MELHDPATNGLSIRLVFESAELFFYKSLVLLVLCLRNPAWGETIFLPEYQAQLRGMLLHVAHVVQE